MQVVATAGKFLRVVFLFVVGTLCWSVPVIARSQTLAEAVNATNLSWTTGGNFNWIVQSDVSFDTNAAAKSGDIGDNQESFIQTSVVGPGTVSFWWKVSSQPFADYLQFFIGTNLQQQISGSVDWDYQKFNVPAGTNILKWRYFKDASLFVDPDSAWLDKVTFSTNATLPLQQVLNTCGIVWSSDGNSNPTFWSPQTNVTHDGGTALQSGEIYHLQTTRLQAVVLGATNVSFWWKVSSEEGFDFLKFYIGTNLLGAISGQVDWTNLSFELPPDETNILRWEYSKDDGVSDGADTGWLDEISITPTLPALPYQFTKLKRLSDGTFSLTVTGEVNCPCGIEVSTNLVDWEVFTNLITTSVSHKYFDTNAVDFDERYYRVLSP